MSRTFVRNGTPVGSTSKCDSCRYAQGIYGYRESEALVFCIYSYDTPLAIPFKVRECTKYEDRNRPDWEQMEKLAIAVNPTPTLKPAGFRIAREGEDAGAQVAADSENFTG